MEENLLEFPITETRWRHFRHLSVAVHSKCAVLNISPGYFFVRLNVQTQLVLPCCRDLQILQMIPYNDADSLDHFSRATQPKQQF